MSELVYLNITSLLDSQSLMSNGPGVGQWDEGWKCPSLEYTGFRTRDPTAQPSALRLSLRVMTLLACHSRTLTFWCHGAHVDDFNRGKRYKNKKNIMFLNFLFFFKFERIEWELLDKIYHLCYPNVKSHIDNKRNGCSILDFVSTKILYFPCILYIYYILHIKSFCW